MRIPKIVTAATILFIVGCEKSSEEPPYEAVIYDRFGSFVSPSGNWQIELSESAPGVEVMRDISNPARAGKFEGTCTLRPSDWRNNDGFFCFVSENDRVWVFDGDEKVWILERFEEGSRSWAFNYPGEIPAKFRDKLPAEVAKKFQ
ncbi:hypothetical protein [Persicirhabdus sediminis]|uniref:Uncharacterized protein n=1 Tax=Persicirhabdus sediminis TaxID=454144 RepID=A0A8J7SPH7_9BACT|nr:hypothetical protein [Persicirhabdus sediminis]MBK1792348.1 hypothetical protein [Persicirhabdus sediminis]